MNLIPTSCWHCRRPAITHLVLCRGPSYRTVETVSRCLSCDWQVRIPGQEHFSDDECSTSFLMAWRAYLDGWRPNP